VTGMVTIVPSRGRPDAAVELATAFAFTKSTCRLIFAIDDNDPVGNQYFRALTVYPNAKVSFLPSRTMVEALNMAALDAANEYGIVGFMGDDHRPRTEHWDAMYAAALTGRTRMVYGNDLIQGERLPTQIAMSSGVIRALGHMGPGALTHLYLDNYWKDLGGATGCIRYVPEVVVEHLHPVAGKAAWDEGYARVNADDMYVRDANAYHAYVASGKFREDVATVRALP
jgi:hypothetical protein